MPAVLGQRARPGDVEHVRVLARVDAVPQRGGLAAARASLDDPHRGRGLAEARLRLGPRAPGHLFVDVGRLRHLEIVASRPRSDISSWCRAVRIAMASRGQLAAASRLRSGGRPPQVVLAAAGAAQRRAQPAAGAAPAPLATLVRPRAPSCSISSPSRRKRSRCAPRRSWMPQPAGARGRRRHHVVARSGCRRRRGRHAPGVPLLRLDGGHVGRRLPRAPRGQLRWNL